MAQKYENTFRTTPAVNLYAQYALNIVSKSLNTVVLELNKGDSLTNEVYLTKMWRNSLICKAHRKTTDVGAVMLALTNPKRMTFL